MKTKKIHSSAHPSSHAEQSEPFISVAEGAALLAVPENTLYKLALARRVPSYKIGKLRRFRRSELIAFGEAFRINAVE
jgi:excisionase family DNA binding protein